MTSFTHGIKWGLGLVWKTCPRQVIISAIYIVLQSFIPLGLVYLLKVILDRFQESASYAFWTDMFPLIGIWSLLYFLGQALKALSEINTQHLNLKLENTLMELVYNKSNAVDLEFYENPEYQDTLHKAQKDAVFQPAAMLNSSLAGIQSLISLLGMGILLVSLHWYMGGFLLLATIPSLIVKYQSAKERFRLENNMAQKERKAWYFNSLITSYPNVRETRLFSIGSLIKDRLIQLRNHILELKTGFISRRAKIEMLAFAAESISYLLTYSFIIFRALIGLFTFGDLVMYIQAFQRSQQFLHAFVRSGTSMYENRLFLQNLLDFLSVPSMVEDGDNPKPFPKPFESIRFETVDFAYQGAHDLALDNVSLEFNRGEKIAIVGENGAGKSTLIKLLVRLYDPTRGTVRINQEDATQIKINDLRRNMSVLSQDLVTFNFTARENIWFGDIKKDEQDYDQIRNAAKIPRADDFIQKLPLNYDTMLGKMFKGGRGLSMGQWQRVALARLIYRDASIIILDEPTSQIDPLVEFEFLNTLFDLYQDRTIILVTHHLNAISNFDKIVVMDQGKIKEQGDHDSLMLKDGLYKRMASVPN